MMLDNGDGTYTIGPWDVLCILQGPDDRYYAAMLEERPMPGPIQEVPTVVRLVSKMTHTAGADTMEEAQEHLTGLTEKLSARDDNVWRDEAIMWGGEMGAIFLREPWRQAA